MIRVPDLLESEEYRILRKDAAAYAEKALAPQAEQLDLNPENQDLRKIISQAGELGMLAALLPESLGGGGLDDYAFCLVLEEIATKEAGIATSLLVHNAALFPASLGESEIPASWLEPSSFPACLAYPCEIRENEGKLDGGAAFAFNAVDSRIITLLLQDQGEISVALVEREEKGVEVNADPYQMGLRAARAGSILLRGAKPLQVFPGANIKETVERILFLGLASIAVGITRNSLERSYAYAKERYQGGKIIIQHQQMRLFLAEMLTSIEQSRAAINRACATPELVPAASAWLLATSRAVQSATDGVQIHGGYGYMRDYGMERLMRDAKYCQMYPLTVQEVLLKILERMEAN